MTIAWFLADRWTAAGAAAWSWQGESSSASISDLFADQPGRGMFSGRGSDTYYQVIAGANDRIDFDEGGGTLTATLTPGLYSASTFATEVKTQMDAAGALTYTVSMGTLSLVATIGATGAFSLLWGSGAAGVAKCARMMGWDATNTASVALQTADRLAVGNYLAAVLDLGSSVTAAAIVMQVAASTEGTPDYAGVRVFSHTINLGGSLAAWEASGTEHVLSTRTRDDAPLQMSFRPLASPVGARYWWVGWVWDDDCLTHTIGLARMWSADDVVWTGEGGNTMVGDTTLGPSDLGGRMLPDRAYPEPGRQVWALTSSCRGWPVDDYISVLLEVQLYGPRRASLFLVSGELAFDGNETDWADLGDTGSILWSTTVVEPAALRGVNSNYRDAAISVRQVV